MCWTTLKYKNLFSTTSKVLGSFICRFLLYVIHAALISETGIKLSTIVYFFNPLLPKGSLFDE